VPDDCSAGKIQCRSPFLASGTLPHRPEWRAALLFAFDDFNGWFVVKYSEIV